MKKLLALAAAMFVALSLSAVAVAADQDPVDPDITSGAAAREFSQAREKWLGSGISDYRMTVHRSCFCAPPAKTTVTVRNGKMVRISARPWYGPRTIPGMFKVVGQAIRNKVPVLDVKCEDRLGFPSSLWIDNIAQAVDDEIGYRITNFRALAR